LQKDLFKESAPEHIGCNSSLNKLPCRVPYIK
jgi:hypothetical protein